MIHPTAFVEPSAELAGDVLVGPHGYVGPHVVLGRRCRLRNNVTITGHTTIGDDNVFYANAVIGEDPQDLKYKGGPTRLEIGHRNCFREAVTIHRGTESDRSVTTIGDDNHIMVGAHVGHDACLGSHTIIGNNTLIAGHVKIEDGVTLGGGAAIHHFCTLGRYAYIAGMARITIDVPPFMIFAGYDGRVRGINTVGLGRWGFDKEQIETLRQVYRTLFPRRRRPEGTTLADALHAVENNGPLDDHVAYLVTFVKRSLADGIHGRYLESTRTDRSRTRGDFYKRDEAPTSDKADA